MRCFRAQEIRKLSYHMDDSDFWSGGKGRPDIKRGAQIARGEERIISQVSRKSAAEGSKCTQAAALENGRIHSSV